ncbi:hypothetical protein RF11_11579 [Thelohanellus kitauei]|uniref:Kelch domain-containing protein 10 n=1 Tax=Thelohanellus kitauei TaxID=669202 RepID=A0A0C2NCF2_THEKT|nr:hypothetical protein RF11_11579 [Thelohanellus kitauei]
MTSVGQFFFIYEGCNDLEYIDYNELWSYNTLSGVWKQYKTPIEINSSCHSSSMCAVGDLVYIFGGSHIDDENIDEFWTTNSLISFDINNASWDIVSPNIDEDYYDYDDIPYSMRTDDHNARDDECEYDMFKFCLNTSTWSKVRQIGVVPIFRWGIFGKVYNNKFYTFKDPYDPKNKYRNVWIFDFSNNRWTTKETNSKNEQYPLDRYEESFAFSSKFGYMNGGACPYTYDGYSDIWRFDLDTLEWLKCDYSLKECLLRHVMLVVDDLYFYSFGGRDIEFDDWNIFQKFNLKPPTLYRLGIESVIRSPNVKIYIKSLPLSIREEFGIHDDDSYANT